MLSVFFWECFLETVPRLFGFFSEFYSGLYVGGGLSGVFCVLF